MRRTSVIPNRGGAKALYVAAIATAGLALGMTMAGAWSSRSYDPEAPPAPVCPMGYEFKDGECALVTQPVTCPTGYHLEGESCSPDVVPTCDEGYVYENGQCVAVEQPRVPIVDLPEPDPKPDPDPDPTPAVIPYAELHGVNYIDPVLMRKEGSPKLPIQKEVIEEFVPIAKKAGFNVFRIPVTWEAYVDNEGAFLGELVALVEIANAHDIFVWINVHHFDATSNWGDKVSRGRGFPESIVACYEPKKSYEHAPEVKRFWNDYYTNRVLDSTNACVGTIDAWKLHADFMKAMIDEVDQYPNVIGYEILNEPHVWKDADYDNLGDMHTAIAKKIRASTDKVIIFTRETAHGKAPDGREYTRQIGLEWKILPKDPAKNVMYVPHLYDLDEIDEHVARWKEVQDRWKSMGYDVGIGVGEWSPQPPQLPVGYAVTQDNMNRFVEVWQREGWMHTYWAYGGFNFDEGNVLVRQSGSLTAAGKYYEKSIDEFYEELEPT